MMSKITHAVKIAKSRDAVYQALIQTADLQGWHSVTAVNESGTDELKEGDVVGFAFAGQPAFRWKVTALKPDETVSWMCLEGPGNASGKTVNFHLSDETGGRTLLTLGHEGWEENDDILIQCNTLWGILLGQLKHYVETGMSDKTLV